MAGNGPRSLPRIQKLLRNPNLKKIIIKLKYYRSVLENLLAHTPFTHFSLPFSRAVATDEVHQGVLFYQTPVAHREIEEDPVMGQEAAPGIGPEEYMETDYEFGEANEVMEEDGDTDKVPNELPTSEERQDHLVPPRDPIDRTRSLEEEVATLRKQNISSRGPNFTGRARER